MYKYITEPLRREKQAYLDLLRYFEILRTLKHQKTKYTDHLRSGTM